MAKSDKLLTSKGYVKAFDPRANKRLIAMHQAAHVALFAEIATKLSVSSKVTHLFLPKNTGDLLRETHHLLH